MEIRRLRDDELQHHGIKGQEWGVKNGPPYPLDKKESKKYYKTIKKSEKQQENLQKKSDKKYGKHTYVRDNKFRDKKTELRKKSSETTKNLLKKAMSDKEFSKIKSMVKTEEDLEFKIDESLGTDKFDSLLKKRNDNYEKLTKTYKDIGYRIAGKYADKKISGGIINKTTLQDHISYELWNMSIDSLIEEGRF